MTYVRVRRLLRKSFYNIYVAAQHEVLLGYWIMAFGKWPGIQKFKIVGKHWYKWVATHTHTHARTHARTHTHTHTHTYILPPKLLSSPAKTSFVRCWIRIYLLETSKSYSLLNSTYHFQTRFTYNNLQHSDVFLVNYEHIPHLAAMPRLPTLNRQLPGRNTCTE